MHFPVESINSFRLGGERSSPFLSAYPWQIEEGMTTTITTNGSAFYDPTALPPSIWSHLQLHTQSLTRRTTTPVSSSARVRPSRQCSTANNNNAPNCRDDAIVAVAAAAAAAVSMAKNGVCVDIWVRRAPRSPLRPRDRPSSSPPRRRKHVVVIGLSR